LTKQLYKKKIAYFTLYSKPYAMTYGQWTVKWWQWAFSIRSEVSPITDKTGKYADLNQPSENVWFLAGKLATENKEFPKRKCRVPPNRAILFPVINCEANQLEYPQLKTERDLINYVSNDEDSIVHKECFINGEAVPATRVRSDPPAFPLNIVKDNFAGIKSTGYTTAAADGYWVFLKPLPKGQFTIKFSGACEAGRLNSGADYDLEVE
jgi:hypothetical protein